MSQQNNDSQLFLLAYDSLDDERRKTPIRTQVFSKGADIGRDFHSEVYLSSETVSARHAKIEYSVETNRWAIVDLNSRNGVIHNGVRVTRQDLKNGDRIQLGEALLVVQIRTDHNERTKSFSFSPNRLAPPDAKAVLKTFAIAGVYVFLYLQMQYHQTMKATQEDLWASFMVWLSIWVFSMVWSFQIRKKPYSVYYAFFQFKSLVALGLLSTLYPVFAMSVLPASWDGFMTLLVYGGATTAYLFFLILSFQKRGTSRNALALSLTLVLGFVALKRVGEHFTGQTLLRPRFSYSFFLPGQRHNTDEMIGALDKAFDRIKENNIDR